MERWANLPHLVRFVLAAGLLLVVGLVLAKPSLGAFRRWRVERNLDAARDALVEVRMQEARDFSLTVLRSGDPRIEAMRILEKSTASLRDPRHSEIARALISHPDGTDEDRLTGFRGIVERIPLGLAGQAWAALPDSCKQDPRFATAFARRLIAEGRLGEAAGVLLGVPELRRDVECERGLIRVLIASGKAEGLAEAQRRVVAGIEAEMAAGGDGRDEWLALLESIPPMSLQPKLLAPLTGDLEREASGGSARDALMLARMDLAANFRDRTRIVDAAVDRWVESAPAEVAGFLKDLGLNQRLLETFGDRSPADTAAFLPLLVEAARESGDWERLGRLLDEHPEKLPRLDELGHRAVLAARTVGGAAAGDAWSAAMAEAASSGDDGFLRLHRLARDGGLETESEEALLAAVRSGRGPLPLFSSLKGLLGSLAKQAQERAILETCAVYLVLEPGNPVLITQYAYLACMNDLAEPGALLQALEPMAGALPEEAPLRYALAAIELCAGRTAEAVARLDAHAVEPGELPPQFRAIHLVARVLAGEMAPDDREIEALPWGSLMPSERRKFEELLRKADSP